MGTNGFIGKLEAFDQAALADADKLADTAGDDATKFVTRGNWGTANDPVTYNNKFDEMNGTIAALKAIKDTSNFITALKEFDAAVVAYMQPGEGHKAADAQTVVDKANALTNGSNKPLDNAINTLSATQYNTDSRPICQGLRTALVNLRANVGTVKNAATVAKQMAQYKILLTQLNDLEKQWKNWRSDPVEHAQMVDKLTLLAGNEGTFSEISVRTKIGEVRDYVDKYSVNESLYALWRNNATYSASAAITQPITREVFNVSTKIKELQSQCGGWSRSEETQKELLLKCYEVANGPMGEVSEKDREAKFQNFYNGTAPSGTSKIFWDLFQMVRNHTVKDRSVVPGRCVPVISGTADDFEPLATHAAPGSSSSHIALFTPIDNAIPFEEPQQETVPKSDWENTKKVLEHLSTKGQDSIAQFVEKQASELEKSTNSSNKNGFYQLNRLLNEIKSNIEQYKILTGSANRNIALSLVKWYNAIVDYGAQYVKISLQKYVNNSLWDETLNPYQEIASTIDENATDGTASKLTNNNSWKITDAVTDGRTDTGKTMLKYIQLDDGGLVSSVYPAANGGSECFRTIYLLKSTFLDEMGKIKTPYKNKTSELETLKTYQDSVNNMLKQYKDLSEEQRSGYNSLSIRAYINKLLEAVGEQFYAYNVETEVGTSKMMQGDQDLLPDLTQSLLTKYTQQLTNLRNVFEATEITRQVNIFYDWFINVEQLYYDWRINSASRAKLKSQLDLLRKVKFAFELPKAIANDQTLTADNVEVRPSANMSAMMDKISAAVTKINGIIAALTDANGTINMANGSDWETASNELAEANSKLQQAQNAREFRSVDDFFTCQDMIVALQKILGEMQDSTLEPGDKKRSLETKMASSGDILRMTSDSYYFSGDILKHMTEIYDHIALYDVATLSDNAGGYGVLADRYGFTGDCDKDQVAIVNLMEKIRTTIKDEFALPNEHRGTDLLASKISGRPVEFAVPAIMDNNDRMRKYHQCWLDFERYASFLVTNFVDKNGERKMYNGTQNGEDVKNCQGAAGEFATIANGKAWGGRLLTYYSQEASGAGGSPSTLQTRFTNLKKVRDQLTTIDYGTIFVDFSLDCLKLYRDFFLNGLRDPNNIAVGSGWSPFQAIREYMSFQGAYLDAQDYIKYLFEEHGDWRNNAAINSELRSLLTDLRGKPLEQRVDLSYKIPGDGRPTENEGDPSRQPNGQSKYCSQVSATVNGAPSNLADYIAILSNNVYGYTATRDPEAIYAMRLAQIDSTLREVLGADTSYDHSALFNTKTDTLVPGGPIITNDDRMENLIAQLEGLVKAWNRQDEDSTKKVFNEMNQDGVYILQNDGSYTYQGTKEAFKNPPQQGKTKTIAGEITTFETYENGTVAATETRKTIDTVRNRILTNELLSIVDSLKSVYLNGRTIKSVGEIYYRVQMAEYIHAMVGDKIRNEAWHGVTGSNFLKSNGCYTFTMGNAENESYFLCGIQNGQVKIIQLQEPELTTDLAQELANLPALEITAPFVRAIDGTEEAIQAVKNVWDEIGTTLGTSDSVTNGDRIKTMVDKAVALAGEAREKIAAAQSLAAKIKDTAKIDKILPALQLALLDPDTPNTIGQKLDELAGQFAATGSLITPLNALKETITATATGAAVRGSTPFQDAQTNMNRAMDHFTVTISNNLAQLLKDHFAYARIRRQDGDWFTGKKDLQGVFYRYTDSQNDPVLTSQELAIQAGGKNYYSSRGGFFDGDGNGLTVDREGFLLDNDGKRVVKEVSTGTTSSYLAYRMDGLTGHLLAVSYNNTTQTEIQSSSGVAETYGMRFANHREMFNANAIYLANEDAHSRFVEEFNSIGTDFGMVYESWKRSAHSNLFVDSSSSFSTKVAQYAQMFSSIGDLLSHHDVKQYREKLAYAEEELMIKRINTLIKNFDAQDGDFKNFANVASRAKAYYGALNRVALAKSIGNVEGANAAIEELAPKKQDYENAKLNAAKDKGNLPAYVQSVAKNLDELTAQMKYQLSLQTDSSVRSQIVTAHAYNVEKCAVARRTLALTLGVDVVGQELDELLANEGLQKDFGDVYTLIQEGSSPYAERPVPALAELWAAEKEIAMQIYEGWRGDSRDARLYRNALGDFGERTYFKDSEEVPLIGSEGVLEYIGEMVNLLETYGEELKRYETYDGLLNDVYALDVIKDGRKRKIAGIGFNAIIKENGNWFLTRAGKATFIEALNGLSGDVDLILQSYDKNGELKGGMDEVLLKKIRAFRNYLGERNGTDKKTYIGRVKDFAPYDDETKYTREQYIYKLQSMELNGIIEPYRAKTIDFEQYQEKIKALKPQGGPLDAYIEQLQGFMDYEKQIDLYHQSLLSLVPIKYASYRGAWHRATDLTDAQLKETNGQNYYRMIYGYGKNGEVQYIEDYDQEDAIVKPVYISADSLWHGDYSNYGVLFRLMAILYEKFTTQKNMLEDLLKEIQANNEKITEANKYLAKINKVQAQAARQGENAKAVIPADVILFFRKNSVTMPSEFFGSDSEIMTYENSDFNKRMNYLDLKNKSISNVLSYVAQGKMQAGGDANLMLADLTNQDLLELGSLKEIYDQTDYADASYSKTSDKAKSADPMYGLIAVMAVLAAVAIVVIGAVLITATGGLATAAIVGLVALGAGAAASLGMAIAVGAENDMHGSPLTFHATDQLVAGDKDHLLEAYWYNRNEIKRKDETAEIKATLNHYTNALIANMDDSYLPYPCSLEGVASNKKGANGSTTNGFQLDGWAPASAGWGSTGHYKYLANDMGEAAGTSSSDFTSGSNQHLVEAFDLMAHQKFYGHDGISKENFTEPDYDYNALILMYKLEALAATYGDHVGNAAVNYLSKRINAAEMIEFINALTDPALGEQMLTPEDAKLIKVAIDGKNLFTDDEDYPMHERQTLTQCWTAKDDIKGILNRLYGTGSKGLNADEVSLWSENMRMYIDKITTEGQTLSTKMQRMMQRCNETTSLATQMLKSIGDLWKQFTGNIR
jgi:hypothetical protein